MAARAWSDAATHLSQSTELLESVVASSPTNPLFQVSLARARWALAESMRRDASLRQSRDVLDKAIADYCSFRDSEAGRRTSLGLLVGLHRQLARTLHELGEDDLAAQAIRTADQLRESGR